MFWGRGRMWLACLLAMPSVMAACRAAGPTVPWVRSFVVSYPLEPAMLWQLRPSTGAPKIPSSPGKTGGRNVCSHIGPRATSSQGIGFCYLFIIFKPKGATLSLWFFEDSQMPLLFSAHKKDHMWKINNPKREGAGLTWNSHGCTKTRNATVQAKQGRWAFTWRKSGCHPKKLCDSCRVCWCIPCVILHWCIVFTGIQRERLHSGSGSNKQT